MDDAEGDEGNFAGFGDIKAYGQAAPLSFYVRSFVIEPSEDFVGFLGIYFFEGFMPYKSD